jgi:hypothetical protein
LTFYIKNTILFHDILGSSPEYLKMDPERRIAIPAEKQLMKGDLRSFERNISVFT